MAGRGVGNRGASAPHRELQSIVAVDRAAAREGGAGIIQILATTGGQDQLAGKDIDEDDQFSQQSNYLKLHQPAFAELYNCHSIRHCYRAAWGPV
jgi:hypothetical protein